MRQNASTCNYCNGSGYVQLLLGGSETCYACKGSGKKDNLNQYIQQNNSSKWSWAENS
ncbi:YuiA family protein [Hazenella coriacea]|uniref:YuiA family protein n=1 Tax=Hazenella coriacea TaxID=1179467 RepID=UPI001404762B